MDDDPTDECIHLLPLGTCSICKPSPPRRRGSGPAQHAWTDDDDTVVGGAYLAHGGSVPAHAKEELAQLIGCSFASVAFRLGNFDAVLGGGSLTNVAERTVRLAWRLSAMNSDERHTTVEAARSRLARRHT